MQDFALVVAGLDIGSVDPLAALAGAGCDDAFPGEIDGVVQVTFWRESETAEAALWSAVRDIEGAVPGAHVTRLDPDLVSTSDIAQRVGRSRESVRLLVEGKRGPGGFPRPVGWVGGGIRVWPWAEAHEWFRSHLGESDEESHIDQVAAAVFNGVLAERGPGDHELPAALWKLCPTRWGKGSTAP
ncbi:MAG: helix-turn-helix transcriptional regulator [Egibacteraceae bacterium]